MVNIFNQQFSHPDPKQDFKISFGGNGAKAGMQELKSVDSIFFPEEVAQMAFAIYEEAIVDGSFFLNEDLVRNYFAHTHDVKALFRKVRLI